MRSIRVLAVVVAATVVAVVGPSASGEASGSTCPLDGGSLRIEGVAGQADAKTYRLLPFVVVPGTARVEVGYEWSDAPPAPPSTPLTQSVLDLGLWDADGAFSPEGFRGWSGSRQGRLHQGDTPVYVERFGAERGYKPGAIEPGTWHAEVGIAAVGPSGLRYAVTIACSSVAQVGEPSPPTLPVDGQAATGPGWYHGDFHMHGFHSKATAPPFDDGDRDEPTPDSFVEFAKAGGLDFGMVTEYVTNQHWSELDRIQAANPDLILFPSREVISYFGHATVFGETPSTVEYRVGLTRPDGATVTMTDIQRDSVADGALFGIAHPTIFPGPVFQNFCRGCAFERTDEVDFDAVATIEVLTGPILVDDSDVGGPGVFSATPTQNPFVQTAIDYWEDKLLTGSRKITAVSGSDDKDGALFGSSATAVYADSLSREAIRDAVVAGRAYVRTRGVHDSPALVSFEALAVPTAPGPSPEPAMIGDTIAADLATVSVRLAGAMGQVMRISANGEVVATVPVTSDDWTHDFVATTLPGSGPLGSFWRVDVADRQSLTLIANPVYLVGP